MQLFYNLYEFFFFFSSCSLEINFFLIVVPTCGHLHMWPDLTGTEATRSPVTSAVVVEVRNLELLLHCTLEINPFSFAIV